MRSTAAALLLVVLLAGCTREDTAIFAAGAGSAGGGGVANVPTTFPQFSASPMTVMNDGTGLVVYSMTYQDNNSETDIVTLRLFVNASAFSSSHAVTKAERAAASEPASVGADGWKVWTVTPNDGVLFAKFEQPIPSGATAGTYVTGTSVTDAAGLVNYPAPSAQLAIVVRAPSLIAVASAPVNFTGVAQVGVSWGAWTAAPGDTNVVSANYLKLVNTGGYPTPTVVVDFTEAVFTGATDASFSVPADGNIQFAWWEDTTPLSTAPNQGTFNFGPTSPGGSVTLTFTASSNIIYVAYRIVNVPSTLSAQTYTASFTATDITP